MATEYSSVDVALDVPFEVEVAEGAYDVSVEGAQSERIPPGRYRVRMIRHLVPDRPVTATEDGEQVLHTADILVPDRGRR